MGGTDITPECTIGKASTAFYELRAKGGAAAVTISECVVHPQTDSSHAFHIDLFTPGSLSSFAYTADAIRRHGAIPSVELTHSGQFAGTYMTDKEKKHGLGQWGVSASVREDGLEIKEMTSEIIESIVNSFGICAGLAKRAGFEMVMVHGGHGWLINQFLSPFFNHRQDRYGGGLENRVRMAQEVLDSIRAAVGPGFPVEFRMSGSELFEGGYDLADGIEIAKSLESRVDLLHVSAGTYQSGFAVTHPSMFVPHGSNVYLAAEIKKHVSIPVATIGGLNDPEYMEEIIASGQADIVEMARALLADHELPKKVITNQDDTVVRCLRCFVCMAERVTTATRRCTVNPFIGRELDGTEILPARIKKKVLVVGGGPSGLQAAITAARRGHSVVLCEKTSRLGGILAGEKAIPFKFEMYQLGIVLEKIARNEGVDIRMNILVTEEYADAQCADAVIIAIGSEPIIPNIPGIYGNNVVLVNDYHEAARRITKDVLVLGGGLAGCEIAVHLAREGKHVQLVEMRDELAPDANIRHRPILLQEIKDSAITVHCGYRGIEIWNAGLVCLDSRGNEHIVSGTTVICALGQRARRAETMRLLNSAPVVMEIGDCVRASTITNAIYQGHHAAMDI